MYAIPALVMVGNLCVISVYFGIFKLLFHLHNQKMLLPLEKLFVLYRLLLDVSDPQINKLENIQQTPNHN